MIAQDILYHEFVPGYGTSWRSKQYTWDLRLNCFLRTISRRRDLAFLVRRFVLSFHLLRNQATELAAQATLEEAAAARGISLARFLLPFRDHLAPTVYHAYRPCGDELVAMLLTFLPNLDRLIILPGTPYRTTSEASLGVTSFPNLSLRTLEICGGDSDLKYRLAGIFEKSSATLQVLNLDSCCGEGIKSLDLFLPKLKNICISSGREIGESDLESLLSRCNGLETFRYETVSNNDCIQPSIILKHLTRHKETLKALYLDLVEVRIINGVFLSEPMPSLQSFPALLDLFLNLTFIYNSPDEMTNDQEALARLLPRSVVSVRLASNAPALVSACLAKGLLCLAEKVSHGYFPHLKRVKCDIGARLDNYDVVEQFAMAGVYFGYATWAISDERRRLPITELTDDLSD